MGIFSKKYNKFSFEDANKVYKIFSRIKNIDNITKKHFYRSNPKFLLSLNCDRDVNFLDSSSVNTLFFLGLKKKELDQDLTISLKKSEIFHYKFGKLISGYYLSLHREIIFIFSSILKYCLKLVISIIDLILIIIYSIIYTFIRNSNKKYRKNFRDHAFFTFYYWKNKKQNSINYYYPDYKKGCTKKAYVIAFFKYKLNFLGFLSILKNKDIVSSLDYINYKKIFLAIKDLLFLHLYEIKTNNLLSYGKLLMIINSFKYLNQRYLAILNLYASTAINTNLKFKSIFIWHENQLNNKSIALGFRNNNKNRNVFTYFGSPYSNNAMPHYVPNKFEIDSGIWGSNNFMHQDKTSILEMSLYLKNKKVNYFETDISLKRYEKIDISKNQKKEFANKRDITFILHIELKEIFILLLRIYLNKENYDLYRRIISTKELNIRAHPALNPKKIIKIIKDFELEYNVNLPYIRFIPNNIESISDTILKSKTCIFGNSAFVNIAAIVGSEVYAIRTSYLHKPQIQEVNMKKNCVTII